MSIADKLSIIAENEQKVYEAGKKSQYDEFWDSFQDYGNRTDYRYAFRLWNDAILKPKHKVTTNILYEIFYQATNLTTVNSEWFEVLETNNNCYSAFNRCSDLEIIDVDIFFTTGAPASAFQTTFTYCSKLRKIKKIKTVATAGYTNCFIGCSALEEVIFDGEIGQGNLDLSPCKLLNKPSIESVVNCLSTTTSTLTVKLSIDAVKKAFETSEGANDGDASEEWNTLANTKENWTISLV